MSPSSSPSALKIESLDSGVTILGEYRSGLPTVSVCIYLPCGVVFDPPDKLGASLLLAELFNRGDASISSHEFRSQLERRGVQYVAGGGFERTVLRIDCLAEHLSESLRLIGRTVNAPKISDHSMLDEARRMLINDIRARNDDSAGIASQKITELFFADPFNRPREGTESGLERSDSIILNEILPLSMAADSTIISWCGNVTHEEFVGFVKDSFSLTHNTKRETPKCYAVSTQDLKPIHVERATEQRSVMIAYESANLRHSGYFPAKVASLCLGGGLFSRLFDEVREKRGLVYDISCSHSSNLDRGWFVVGFACAPQKFSSAIDVVRDVLVSFSPSDAELQRARRQVSLSLAVGDESRGSRCETLASEWAYHGRVRSENELIKSIGAVDQRAILELWEAFPPFRHPVIVTVGGEA